MNLETDHTLETGRARLNHRCCGHLPSRGAVQSGALGRSLASVSYPDTPTRGPAATTSAVANPANASKFCANIAANFPACAS